MPSVNSKNIWNQFIAPPSILGWRDILQSWDESVSMHPNVEVLLDNLHAASDYRSYSFNMPLDHFLRYLNYEPEAIQWFIYEIIAMRWMWGESRLDFIQTILNNRADLVDLEATFCHFIGSPCESMTLRQFLVEHLNPDEVRFLNMPPPLVAPTYPPAGPQVAQKKKTKKEKLTVSATYSEDGSTCERSVTTPSSNSRFDNPPIQKKKKQTPFYSKVLLRFIAEKDQDASKDECLWISKTGEDEYEITYHIQSIGKKRTQYSMSRKDVEKYLSTVLRILALDEDPYNAIQFEVPHMPYVLLNPKLDSYSRNLLYDALDSVFDKWPLTVKDDETV